MSEQDKTANKLFPIIEAILFASGEPISLQRLSLVLNINKAPLRETMEKFMGNYNNQDRGIMVVELDQAYQLCTKAEYSDYIKQTLDIKKNTPLSQASLEVLAIIAYNEPVTRGFVEQVRGVDSNYIINSLILKGLIKEAGRLDIPGKPLSYKTTKAFLRSFGMSNLSELPQLPKETNQLEITLEQ